MAALRAGMAMLAGLLLAGCGGGDDESPVMPSVAVQPADAEITAGDRPELRVQAEGTPPLQFQWRRNGIDIPGATDGRLVLPPATTREDGDEFDVMVSNAAGSEFSRAATLTVRGPTEPDGAPEPPAPGVGPGAPMLAEGPIDAGAAEEGGEGGPVIDGADPAITADMTTDGVVSDDETVDEDGPAGAEASPDEDVPPVVTTAEETEAMAEDGNAEGRVARPMADAGEPDPAAPRDARAAPLAATVPTITLQPRSVLANPGQTATFRVLARGTAPLRYQWRRNNVDIAGATRASYTTPRLTLALDRSRYRVVVRNAAGARLSTAATLIVTERPIAPSFAAQPLNLRVAVGAPATFRVQVLGSTASFQWFRDGSPIPGATGARYLLARPRLADSGARFRVRVTNRIGTVLSLPATLTVGDALIAPGIALQPASLTARSGASASFLVTPMGTPPFRYQWRRNGVAIPGATAARLGVRATMANQGAAYSVRIRNAAGSRLSRSAVLSVADVTAGPLLQRRNCLACHAYDRTLHGPSFLAIADRYAGQPRTTYLVQRIRGGGRGAWGATPMPAYPQVTVAEAGAIANWLLAGAPPSAGPPTLARQPADVQVQTGALATFSVAARGVSRLGYQWRRNGAVVLGATGPSYTTEVLETDDDGTRITVTVRSVPGSVTSRAALLGVMAPYPYPYPYSY
jgi:cytochrome c551/c552